MEKETVTYTQMQAARRRLKIAKRRLQARISDIEDILDDLPADEAAYNDMDNDEVEAAMDAADGELDELVDMEVL